LVLKFIELCRKRGKYERIVFMAKKNLVPMYERMGFGMIGKANVVFGKDEWFEMCMSF